MATVDPAEAAGSERPDQAMNDAWSPESPLWQSTLAERYPDCHAAVRAGLRAGLRELRAQAAELAEHIEHDLPDFTIHDVRHLDALWPLASTIAPDLQLTPSEGYLYGAAVLLHDLGLALAAYPGGRQALHTEPAWSDEVGVQLRRRLGRAPTPQEIADADDDLRIEAERSLLRSRHASRAGDLGTAAWQAAQDDAPRLLIVNDELREAFGHLAGQIAASHWWPAADLPRKLPELVGAPAAYPTDWTMRPVLIACLLRLADAAHLDAGRAPPGLRAGRPLGPESAAHWQFQARLLQATRRDDALIFTSASTFPPSEARAWWLCLDVLRSVDREMREVDALLADREGPRFRCRFVAGIEDPRRLAKFVTTEGWEPVDARVEVSDVARLVARVGGEQLYGGQGWVPLRELIQNASDAILARAELHANYTGRVTVRIGARGERHYLEVEDNGLGMTPEVMTGVLLDFGRSLWESTELPAVLPGLAGTGFQPTGRFGIGFFSVFMWAREVEVVSRPFRGAEADTHVLSFGEGLGSRPLLRRAMTGEQLQDGGSLVRLWWGQQFNEALTEGGVDASLDALAQICRFVAPALSVDLWIDVGNEQRQVVAAGDWLTISGEELLARTAEGRRGEPAEIPVEAAHKLGSLLRVIRAADGSPVARAALLGAYIEPSSTQLGALVDGGLHVRWLPRTAGLWQGLTVNTARDRARTQVTMAQLGPWATEQATLFAEAHRDPVHQREQAQAVAVLGGYPGPLVVCRTSEGWMNLIELETWAAELDEVRLADIGQELEHVTEHVGLPMDYVLELEPQVVETPGWFFGEREILEIANDPPTHVGWERTLEAFIQEAIARAWGLGGHGELNEEQRNDARDVLGHAGDEPLYPVYTRLRRAEGSKLGGYEVRN